MTYIWRRERVRKTSSVNIERITCEMRSEVTLEQDPDANAREEQAQPHVDHRGVCIDAHQVPAYTKKAHSKLAPFSRFPVLVLLHPPPTSIPPSLQVEAL